MKKIIFGILVLTLLAATSSSTARPTYAAEGDEYKEMYWSLMQDCPNVKGDVVAWYPEGYHWIYGYSPVQWGADKVWHVGYDNYVQCFCPKKLEGFEPLFHTGIKTAWLKAGNVGAEKQQDLLAKGWLWLDNGVDVGLLPEPYMARNSKWNCQD